DVGRDDVSFRPDDPCRRQRRLAVTGGHVENPVAGFHAGQLNQAFVDPAGESVDELAPLPPSARSDVPALALLIAELRGIDGLGFHGTSRGRWRADPKRATTSRRARPCR